MRGVSVLWRRDKLNGIDTHSPFWCMEIGYPTVGIGWLFDFEPSEIGDVHAHNIKKEGRIFVLGKHILVCVIDLRGAEFKKEYSITYGYALYAGQEVIIRKDSTKEIGVRVF